MVQLWKGIRTSSAATLLMQFGADWLFEHDEALHPHRGSWRQGSTAALTARRCRFSCGPSVADVRCRGFALSAVALRIGSSSALAESRVLLISSSTEQTSRKHRKRKKKSDVQLKWSMSRRTLVCLTSASWWDTSAGCPRSTHPASTRSTRDQDPQAHRHWAHPRGRGEHIAPIAARAAPGGSSPASAGSTRHR